MSNEMTSSKNVTVFNTHGQNRNVLRGVTATNWAQLQDLLRRNNIPYEGMRAVVGDTQVTLESDGAQIPPQDFTLFLLPSKVKSGNWGSGSNFIQIQEDPIEEEQQDEEQEYEGYDPVVNPQAVAMLVSAMSNILTAVKILTSQHPHEGNIVAYDEERDAELDELAQKAQELMRSLS
jgi:hypothetical protein